MTSTRVENDKKRLKIITGHYGSGKTEFSINFALSRANAQKKVALADLDIVNPFFRSREKYQMLEDAGVRILSTNLGKGVNSDLPALDARILSVFDDETCEYIVDMGGDPAGAKLLGRFHGRIEPDSFDMWMVVNANRRETSTAGKVLKMADMIEDASRLKITGLINNTHMMKETVFDDVLRGNKLCAEAGKAKGVPVVYNCIGEHLKGVEEKRLKEPLFPIKIYVRPKWM